MVVRFRIVTPHDEAKNPVLAGRASGSSGRVFRTYLAQVGVRRTPNTLGRSFVSRSRSARRAAGRCRVV